MSEDIDELLARSLRIPRGELKDDLEYGEIRQWNSLAHVNLMLALEEAYGLPIDEDRMVELTSVRAIKDFVKASA
jgi:citrate synthase